jgi:hypothetical protein
LWWEVAVVVVYVVAVVAVVVKYCLVAKKLPDQVLSL